MMFLRILLVSTILVSCSRVYAMSNGAENFILSPKNVVGAVYRQLETEGVHYCAILQNGSIVVAGKSREDGINCTLQMHEPDEPVVVLFIAPKNFHVLKRLYEAQQQQGSIIE